MPATLKPLELQLCQQINGDGRDRAWLHSDRVAGNRRWQIAMNKITALASVTEVNRLKPFGQILDYYKLISIWIKGRNHQSRWLNGAYFLVQDLWEAYEGGNRLGACFSSDEVIDLLKKLNVAIADYATRQFKRLLITDYKNIPQRGQDAYNFDRNFILFEQINVAFPAYLRKNETPDGRGALSTMSGIYNNTNILGWLKSLDPTGITIPVFPGYYESNLASRSQSFGQDSRVQVPICMLYPNSYFIDDSDGYLNNKILYPRDNPDNNRSYFNPNFRATLKKGSSLVTDPNNLVIVNSEGVIYLDKDSFIFNIYRITNIAVMKIFK